MHGYDENPLAKGLSKIISEKLKECSYANGNRYQLLVILDDLVLVWCKEDACLYAQILQPVADLKKTIPSFQILALSRPPIWEVEKLIINSSGTGVLLVGSKGLVVVELPKRWGSPSLFEGGAETITCRVEYIGEEFFTCNIKINIISAAWHPGSLSHEHVIVLASDNYLRIYNVSCSNIPEEAIAVGKTRTFSRDTAKLSCEAALGEIAVAFDTGSPIYQEDLHMEKLQFDEVENLRSKFLELQWPIFILYSNGDVYYVLNSLSRNRMKRRKLYGPLSMLPNSYDNYGLDFCSLLVLPSSPVVLVIGNSMGTLHHCIVLEKSELQKAETKTIEDLSNDVKELNLESANIILHVYETINLDLSFTYDPKSLGCPLSLIADPHTPARYWILHEEGVHGVSVPVVERLVQFGNLTNECEFPEMDLESRVEHFVCTRPVSSVKTLPVIGLAFSFSPPCIFVLLSSGVMFSLPLPSVFLPPMPELGLDETNTTSAKTPSVESFSKHIRNLLQSSSSQPLLVFGANPQIECEEYLTLLTQVTDTLRKNYVEPQIKAREQIQRRQNILSEQKMHLEKELATIQIEKVYLTDKAHELAERYEDANDTHTRLMKRLEKVMSTIVSESPMLSGSERAMLNELQAMKDRSQEFSCKLSQIQAKHEWQLGQLEKHKSNTALQSQNVGTLSETQLSSLRSSLRKESEKLKNLTTKVTSLKKEFGL